MSLRVWRLLSPATVIAIIALVFAAAGTGYAVSKLPKNSVSTTQIKNGAVTTPKLATTTAARLAGLTYKKVAFTADPGTGGVVTVSCPAGLTAIGGGLETPHTPDAFLLDSHPTATGWEMSAANAGTAPATINAYAVCAKVEGGKARIARVAQAAGNVRRFTLDR